MSATRIVVLLTLKPGRAKPDYEAWARSADLPTVNALRSVRQFAVYEATGQLGSDAPPPCDYIEVLDIDDMALFGAEVASDRMQQIAAQFREWGEPVFITTRELAWQA